MKTHPVRLREDIYEALRQRAEAEHRSVTQQANHLLMLAIVGNLKLEPAEPWPGEADALEIPAAPIPDTPDSVAEKAKGARAIMDRAAEALAPEPEPWPEPVAQRADEITPDWK